MHMSNPNNMLAGHKQQLLTELVTGIGREELIWINGYLSALIDGKESVPVTAGVPAAARKITLVYGTETGNAKKLATAFAAKAKKENLQVKLAALDQYRLTDLSREENLFVVISTQGDGDPPVAAQKFYDHIHRKGFRLDQLRYSVLALGDTSYPYFCKTGEDVDNQLEKLGGQRVVPIRKCDVDYEKDAESWFEQVLLSVRSAETIAALPVKATTETATKANKKIYTATLAGKKLLNDLGSHKAVYHLELLAEAVEYEPGDAIGIIPHNPTALVNRLFALTGFDRVRQYSHKNELYTAEELLQQKLAVCHLHERVVKKYAAMVQQDIPEQRADLLQLLENYPLQNETKFEELIEILPAQSPRIYTIASSPAAYAGEVHLTVELDRFTVGEGSQNGLCSGYLAALPVGATVEFFVQKNKRFRLPDGDKKVLMIGQGTGIAAFRSFLAERDATGASGKNWLFFGEDSFTRDFLYQTELQDWYQTGVLSGISLAFRQDQSQVFLVAEKLQAHAKDVYNWIQDGAYLYVCGEKSPMSESVEKALLQIIAVQGNVTTGEAQIYFEQLKTEGRYSKDVY